MFSIISPSFRSGKWLKLCIASVADQATELEHIIQEAGSEEPIEKDPRIKVFVERDAGMYDGINLGLRRAKGDVLAWLNADEQYLPGTLKKVRAWFERHSDVDVLFGDVILVDNTGNYVGHRKMQVPLLYHTWTCHLSTLSCGMFFRRRLVAERGFYLDAKWRCSGDAEWMLRLLRAKVKMGTLNEFTSVFTQTGSNLSAGPHAVREAQQLRASAPAWARWLRLVLIGHHRLRRVLGGMYRQQPFAYDIYTLESPSQRRHFEVARLVGRIPR